MKAVNRYGLNKGSKSANAGDAIYTNTENVVQAIGGVKIGDSFPSGISYHDLFTKLLYPELPPVVHLDVTPSDSLLELGHIQVFTLDFVVTKQSFDISLIEVLVSGSVEQTITSSPNGGTFQFLTSGISSVSTFQIRVTDAQGNVVSSSMAQVDRVFPILYGDSAIEVTNYYTELNRLIIPVSQQAINVPFNSSSSYFYFAAPSLLGPVVSITDQNGFPVINGFSVTENVPITKSTPDTWTTDYRVYRTLNLTNINGTYTFNFS